MTTPTKPTRKKATAPAKPARERKTITIDAAGARLLVRGAELLDVFSPLFNQYETANRIKAAIEGLRAVEATHELDADEYNVTYRFIPGLRALVSSGTLSPEDAVVAAKLDADYMATRPWDKHAPEKFSIEWRLRVWLLDHGYGPHVYADVSLHGQGLPPGRMAMVNRWRADVDGKHVLVIYDDCVREATLTTPYNHGSWRVHRTQPYQTSDELDAILRPWTTKPGTTWERPIADAKPVESQRVVDDKLAGALLRSLSVRLDATSEDLVLIRAFFAGLKGGG